MSAIECSTSGHRSGRVRGVCRPSLRLVRAVCVLLIVGWSAGVVAVPPERGTSLSTGGMSDEAVADDKEMTELEFRVPLPEHESGTVRLQAGHRIAKRAAKRLDIRYDVAQVPSAQVEVTDGASIIVKAAPGTDPGWLEQIAVPNGAFVLGPVIGSGGHWTDVSGRLPSGIEIRQPGESLRAEEAYLWSRERSRLESVVESMQPSVGTAYVYPENDAWRTLTAGDPIFTHEQIESASVQRAPTGTQFVELKLDAKGQQALDVHANTEQTWLAVSDGEAVATIERLGVHGDGKLPLRPPNHLSGEDKKEWARLLASRLAVHMPVKLIPERKDARDRKSR